MNYIAWWQMRMLSFVITAVPLPPASVSEGIMLSGCLSTVFVCLDGSCYHDISWTAWTIMITKTDGEYLLAATDELIKFWRSKVKVTAGRQVGKGVLVDAGASKFIF